MDVNRVSIWKYEATPTEIIQCEWLFDKDTQSHNRGMILEGKYFPAYFNELKSEKLIDAELACKDDRTKEFSDSYLIPLGIISLLDIPIFKDGSLKGIICIENRLQKTWTLEDQMLVRSVANLCTIAYTQEELKKAFSVIENQKKLIEEYNSTLETKVKERTIELEKRNGILEEYAFINSHLLRGPICPLRGLVNLLNISSLEDLERKSVIDNISITVDKLNLISDNINSALATGKTLDSRPLKSHFS